MGTKPVSFQPDQEVHQTAKKQGLLACSIRECPCTVSARNMTVCIQTQLALVTLKSSQRSLFVPDLLLPSAWWTAVLERPAVLYKVEKAVNRWQCAVCCSQKAKGRFQQC